MQREDQIINILEDIRSKLDERSEPAENHSAGDSHTESAVLKDLATKTELLYEDVWQNRLDIQRSQLPTTYRTFVPIEVGA
ncbi:hypothetical protein KFZ58_15835 [Virgibacillus sp. NKC19-16]|uniref:hypothetical protein n=1 Tax=Virgibacillus salidurans TaxID=2831673 RepID=UPI001F21BBFE|nr:hypothetical protein [Virgibacillus sp. NKC19-16]UJL45834.1 hypothetical protein KFZ58_15835 [Virgibacillus sp. NKC19-16]